MKIRILKSNCRPRIRADDWTLVITATEARDAGTYECRCKENVKKIHVLYMTLGKGSKKRIFKDTGLIYLDPLPPPSN